MTAFLESLLAKLTGRAAWPTVTAEVTEHLQPQDNKIGPIHLGARGVETADIFRYEVDGVTYIRAIREVVGDAPLPTGTVVALQYNPKRPSQCYYAPDNQLAARAVVCIVIAVCVAIVVVSVHLHH